MVKKIPLQNGMFALVDDEDYERCMEHLWSARVKSTTFAVTRTLKNNKHEVLQHFIKQRKAKEGFIYFFVDRDSLNFQKCNLIEVPEVERNQSKKGNKKSSSKYKGVSWNKRANKWKARIQVDGHEYHLGFFMDEDEAAKSYNVAAINYFGEDCYLNVIGKDNSALNITLEKTTQRRRAIK